MLPGMVFTIEPIISEHGIEVFCWKDGFTLEIVDKSWHAQFEHTILITETGHEILTQ